MKQNISCKKRLITEQRVIEFSCALSQLRLNDEQLGSLPSNDIAEMIMDTLGKHVDQYFPVKEFRVRSKTVSWYNSGLRGMRREMNRCHKLYLRNPNEVSWELYPALSKQYKEAIIQEKKASYTSSIIGSNNMSKTVWSIVNSERNSKNDHSIKTLLTADDFNKYFTSVADIISQTIPHTAMHCMHYLNKAPKPSGSLFFAPILVHDVRRAVNTLSNSKWIDIYGLNSAIIKSSLEHLITPLTILFNKCLSEVLPKLALRESISALYTATFVTAFYSGVVRLSPTECSYCKNKRFECLMVYSKTCLAEKSLVSTHRNCNNLLRHSDIHNYNARTAGNLMSTYSRLDITTKNKIDVNLYNMFVKKFEHNNCRNMSIASFRILVKNNLLEQCFYSVDEFKLTLK
nr:unnamed protein product [Callosobruchus analis]